MEVVPLTSGHHAEAAAALARAFEHDPLSRYTFPDATRRLARERWVYEHWFRVTAPMGGSFITAGGEGVAVWWPPGGRSQITLSRVVRAGFLWAPFHLGVRYLSRMMQAARDMDLAHFREFGDDFWYLDILGVDPRYQRSGAGGALIRHVTRIADNDGAACCLMTHNLANIPYYERFGFRLLKQTLLAPDLVASSLRREPAPKIE